MRKQWQGMEVTELRSPDGAAALVADHGAHLLSWAPASGEPALFLSELSQYGTGSAIRGGVPVIFPQFGERGSGKRHGFARVLPWRPVFAGVEAGRAVARYCLDNNDLGDLDWQHRFELTLEIAVAGLALQETLTIHNPSDEVWECCAALHTYLQVSDLATAGIEGLQHAGYIDQTQGGFAAMQKEALLRFDGEVDRIYPAVKNPVLLADRARKISVSQGGFRDIVVWNPGAEKAGRLTDMRADDYLGFVCVEAGAVIEPIRLAPHARWTGSQQLTVVRA